MTGYLLTVLGCFCFALAALAIAVMFARKHSRAVFERNHEASAKLAAEARAASAEHEVASLSQFRHIVDAQREAASVRETARTELERAREDAQTLVATTNHQAMAVAKASEQQAQALLSDAQTKASSTLGVASREAHQLVADAERQSAVTIENAKQQGISMVFQAEQQAQEVAGDALRARAELESNRREARALQNVIDGYGDRYIVPAHSVLDDLAEVFGFAEAGANLKAAREKARALLKAGGAAACDYVEANRRDTAIAFVSDAFNGKVDSILSTLKEDNVGTLRQRILDAFALVNMNGRAFRSARITNEYLASRLEELRWAAAAQELKNREREEQRRIKEQIREEEKARREYERAIREAEKEEEGIKKAMDKIQQSVAKATDEQRQRYEVQLAELQEKLKAAEEKNQRALSMAQQTKTGHVYVISNIGSFGKDVFKIGLTRRLEPLDRVRELGDASVPFEFDVHALILSDDAPALEHMLHRHFLASQLNKINPRKEFFRVPLAAIRAEIAKLGIQASWTMTAVAAEYKQSLAVEKAIRDNPAQYQAWVSKQLVLDAQIEATDERDFAEAS